MKSILFLCILFSFNLFNAQNSFKYLDINNVKAGVSNSETIHYNESIHAPSNEVPIGTGLHSDFACGLWFGAYDNANVLHVAAQTYRQAGNDFWPRAAGYHKCCNNFKYIMAVR